MQLVVAMSSPPPSGALSISWERTCECCSNRTKSLPFNHESQADAFEQLQQSLLIMFFVKKNCLISKSNDIHTFIHMFVCSLVRSFLRLFVCSFLRFLKAKASMDSILSVTIICSMWSDTAVNQITKSYVSCPLLSHCSWNHIKQSTFNHERQVFYNYY